MRVRSIYVLTKVSPTNPYYCLLFSTILLLFPYYDDDSLVLSHYSLLFPTIPYYSLLIPTILYYTLLIPTIPYYSLLFPTIPHYPLLVT